MATLYKRATFQQQRILRAIEGAVKNAADAHPRYNVDRIFARSVAKRAAGTLTAQWPEVLAARSVSSYQAKELALRSLRPRGAQVTKHRERGASHLGRRSPLALVWKRLAILIGEAKRRGDGKRAETLIEAIRIIDAVCQEIGT